MGSIFTKIVAGEIPSYKIAEDEHHYAFLDINPAARGHTLVIPKEEVDYIFDLSDARVQSLMLFAKNVARALDQVLEPIRIGIIVEGLEVPHAHIHLIPIYTPNQAFSLGKKIEMTPEEMQSLAEVVNKALNA